MTNSAEGQITDETLQAAIQRHRDKTKNPRAILALINQYVPAGKKAPNKSNPGNSDARDIPQSARAAFLKDLAAL